jgi:hypothetical protein
MFISRGVVLSHADAVDRIVDVSPVRRGRRRGPAASARRRLRVRRPVQGFHAIRRPAQRYESETPRAALGALAVAVALVTMVALVLVPAALESAAHALY